MRAARGDRQSRSRPGSGRVYEGAFESVFAILIAGGIGYWADKHFGTEPRYLLVGLAIGFGAFVLRLWKLGVALQQFEPGEIGEAGESGSAGEPSDDRSEDRPEAGSSNG